MSDTSCRHLHSIENGRHSFEDAIITNIQCLIKHIAINDLTKELPLQEQVGTALEIALKAHRGQRDLDGSVQVRQPHITQAIAAAAALTAATTSTCSKQLMFSLRFPKYNADNQWYI